jgi:hypothetical protein
LVQNHHVTFGEHFGVNSEFTVFFGLLANLVLSPMLHFVDFVLLSEFKYYRLVYLVPFVRVGGNRVHQIHSFVNETIGTLAKLFIYQVSVVEKDSLNFVDYSDLISVLLSKF